MTSRAEMAGWLVLPTPTEELPEWLTAETAPEPVGADERFWSERAILGHVRDTARARLTAPWAVFGCLLARVAATVPPRVRLPPLIGGHGSLNLFIAVVGPPGCGKGAADQAAAAALHGPDLDDLRPLGIGSGEGLAHLYARLTKGGPGQPPTVEQHCESALLTAPEIGSVAALADRRGSTLLPEMRRAWSAEPLGMQTADPTRRMHVRAHRYRLALTVGVQPRHARILTGDADAGTPQRFLWMPAVDGRGGTHNGAGEPEPWRWQVPPLGMGTAEHRILAVAETVVAEVRADRIARLTGHGSDPDGATAHRGYQRLKVAALLGILEGRLNVDTDDWRLAGQVLDVSDRCREATEAAGRQAATEANRTRAVNEGERSVIAASVVADHAAKRVARVIERAVGKAGPDGITRGVLARHVAGRDRDFIAEGLERAERAGLVRVVNGPDGAERILPPTRRGDSQ